VGELSVAIDNEGRTYPRDVETAMAAELLSVGAAAPERTAQKTGCDPNVLQHQ
jgi:hypothetical protein